MDVNGAERCLDGICSGTYVSARGADKNPGTRERPKATIAAGLAMAARLRGTCAGPAVPVFVAGGTYSEDLDLPDPVDLRGGYSPRTWERDLSTNVTVIHSTNYLGVRLSKPTMTRTSAIVSGFHIIGPESTTSRAMLVNHGAQPTLSQLDLLGGGAGANGLSAALVVAGAGSRPLLLRSALIGGAAGRYTSLESQEQGRSDGIRLESGASIDVVATSSTGGDAARLSAGLSCDSGSCAGMTLTDATFQAAPARESAGVRLRDGVGAVLTRTLLQGAGGGYSMGLHVESCSLGAVVEVRESTLIGAPAQGTHGLFVGDCSVDVHESLVLGSTGDSDWPTGVYCGHATCRLVNNHIGAVGPAGRIGSYGVAFSATASVVTLERNFVAAGRCTPAGPGATGQRQAFGISMWGKTLSASNNIILGGECDESTALLFGEDPGGLVLAHNHVDPIGVPGASRTFGFVSATASEAGTAVNNTILGGGGVESAAVMLRSTATLLHNNLHGGAALLRTEDGSLQLTTVVEVNARSDAEGNISADPGIVGPENHHLTAGSPNRGAGQASVPGLSLPQVDRDLKPRPLPAGTPPDIGPYERD